MFFNNLGVQKNITKVNREGEEVVVFDQNSNISFLGCGMALWIGGQISKPDGLFYSDKQKLESQGAKVNMNTAL